MNLFLQPTAIISILIALSVHEFSHAFIANRLGDPTAEHEGRMTLNPIAHLDPIGTLMFLFVGFGWGKPVPVNPNYFKNPKRDNAWVAFAGPISNLIVAFVAFACLLSVLPDGFRGSPAGLLSFPTDGPVIQTFFLQLFGYSIFINLALMAFNLLPIAPLDGSKFVHMFVPYQYEHTYRAFMQRGPFILIGLLIADQMLNIPILIGWITGVISPVLYVMDAIAKMVL